MVLVSGVGDVENGTGNGAVDGAVDGRCEWCEIGWMDRMEVRDYRLRCLLTLSRTRMNSV